MTDAFRAPAHEGLLALTPEVLSEPVAPRGSIPDQELLVASFLAGYRNDGTRKGYMGALKQWFRWCNERGIEDPIHDVVRAHVELWLRQMEEFDGKSPRTVCGYMCGVGMFYRYLYDEGHIDKDPAARVKRPRIERVSTTKHLTRVELGQVFEQAAKVRVRDEAILRLLGLNGVRVGELVRIDIEHLDRERGYKTVFVTRKGDKTQTLPLAPPTAWAIERLVDELAAKGYTSGPLFHSLRTAGKRLNRNDVGRLVKHYAELAGIRKRITPHSFRHSFITLSLDAGVHERDVMNSSGHADPRMTRYYDRNRESLARNATHTLAAFVEGAI